MSALRIVIGLKPGTSRDRAEELAEIVRLALQHPQKGAKEVTGVEVESPKEGTPLSPAEAFLLTALSVAPEGQQQRVLVAIGRDAREALEQRATSGDDEAVVFLEGHTKITYSALRTAVEKLEKRYPGLKVEKDTVGFQGRSVWSLSYEGKPISNGELGWTLPTSLATGATPEALRALDAEQGSSAGASGEESEPEG